MNFTIETGYPTPGKTARGRPKTKPDFASLLDLMKIDESFSYPAELRNNGSTAINRFEKKFPDRKFTSRKQGNIIRVWRIA